MERRRRANGNRELWAITSYFNPRRYRRRLANYKTFRRHLAVPLVTVEWSCDGAFELESSDADVLIQLGSPDLLWQKERLLNLAVAAVPEQVDRIAWLDCDKCLPQGRFGRRTAPLWSNYGAPWEIIAAHGGFGCIFRLI